MLTAELFEYNDSKKEAVLDTIQQKLLPLFNAYWDKQQELYDNRPFNPNMQVLLNLWVSGTVKIIVVKDEAGNYKGLLIGMPFRPIEYQGNTFQVLAAQFYDSDAEQSAMNFLKQALAILGCDTIVSEKALNFSPWQYRNSVTLYRYVRE